METHNLKIIVHYHPSHNAIRIKTSKVYLSVNGSRKEPEFDPILIKGLQIMLLEL